MTEPTAEATIARLRRRLWIERGLFLTLLLLVAGAWLYPLLFPSVWAVYVNDRPVIAMADRAEIRAALERVKQQQAAGAGSVEFVQRVKIDRAHPERVEVADARTAVERLAKVVQLRAPRGVIYVDGLAVVALPNETAARRVLERVKTSYADSVETVDAPAGFKESVEVRVELAEQEAWADEETALALLKGEGEEQREYPVARGDSAWEIARRHRLTVEDLQKLNPDVNLSRLQTGQVLQVAAPADPLLTVVAEGRLTRTQAIPFPVRTRTSPGMYVGKRIVTQPGRLGEERVTYRVRVENGVPVERDVESRTRVRSPREQVVVVGGKPRL